MGDEWEKKKETSGSPATHLFIIGHFDRFGRKKLMCMKGAAEGTNKGGRWRVLEGENVGREEEKKGHSKQLLK